MITSINNEKIKQISKLNNKKYRKKMNLFIVEGPHLVYEALKCGILKEVIALESFSMQDFEITYVTIDVMKKLSNLTTYPEVIGICSYPKQGTIKGSKILLLNDIQDPGNLGTILRSAVSFNVDTVILSPNCVDLYSDKVLRSSQGIMFHLNIIIADIKDAISTLKSNGYTIYATDVKEGINIQNIKNKTNIAVIMGNEGQGLSTDIISLCDNSIHISMSNKSESLNVAVATSIILYELNK